MPLSLLPKQVEEDKRVERALTGHALACLRGAISRAEIALSTNSSEKVRIERINLKSAIDSLIQCLQSETENPILVIGFKAVCLSDLTVADTMLQKLDSELSFRQAVVL